MTKILNPRGRKIQMRTGDRLFLGFISLLLVLVAICTLFPFLDVVLTSITPTEEIVKNAKALLTIPQKPTLAHYAFVLGGNQSILRAMGDTRRPLYFLIVACLTNIVLDLLFVVVLGLGVLGVAVATVLSQVVAAILIWQALRAKDTPYELSVKEIGFDKPLLKRILRIGLPAGIQSDMYTLSNILIQSAINSFGTNTIAAWTAFGKVDGFFWMVLGAFGVAITTFVGQNFGAQEYGRVRKSVRVCLGMSFLVTALGSTLFCLAARPLIAMFCTDAQVLEAGVKIMWMLAPCYFLFVCIEILSGAVRGTGDSLIPTLITCGGVCVLRILWLVFVLPKHHSFETILVSYPVTWVITSALFIVYYLQGGWMRRGIAKMGLSPEVRQRKA